MHTQTPAASDPRLVLTQFNVYLEVNGSLDFKINRMKKLQTVMAKERTFSNPCWEKFLD